MHLMPASGPINLLTREFEINENKETSKLDDVIRNFAFSFFFFISSSHIVITSKVAFFFLNFIIIIIIIIFYKDQK